MTDSIQFMEENRQGVTIVHLVNQRLIEPQLSDDLTSRLCALIEGGTLCMLIDMGAVARISSVFFRSFITAGKKANEHKVKIAFCNLTPLIKEGFTITGLDKLFKIYDTEGKAMGELGE
jgi:anti-sigma B factor antagonist